MQMQICLSAYSEQIGASYSTSAFWPACRADFCTCDSLCSSLLVSSHQNKPAEYLHGHLSTLSIENCAQ